MSIRFILFCSSVTAYPILEKTLKLIALKPNENKMSCCDQERARRRVKGWK